MKPDKVKTLAALYMLTEKQGRIRARSRQSVTAEKWGIATMRAVLWAYSFIFRYFGLLMAVLSACVSVALAIDFARQGYVLVNGEPNRHLSDMIGIAAAPLAGVLLGLCLFFFVPRVKRGGS